MEKVLAAPDAQAQLVALKAIDSSYRQRQFIEAGGRAVMPSKDEATRQAADLCANVLIDLAPDAPAEAEGGLQPTSTPSEPGRVGSSGWESLPVAADWSSRPVFRRRR